MTTKQYWLTIIIVLTLSAAWPQGLWMARRLTDGSDEPWGIISMLTIITLFMRENEKLQQPKNCTLAVTAIFMVTASVTWGGLPPIFSTAFAVLGITCLLSGLMIKKQSSLPFYLLALLALPLTASLNFYFGYPLRWICAHAVAPILSVLGLAVTPQGTALLWNGKSILIDAPCAGIAMLWLGFYLTALFSFLNLARPVRCLFNLLSALAVVVIANILRNALLFYKEANIIQLPHWTHEAVGLAIFGLMVVLIFKLTALRSRSGEYHEIL